jgi:putative spermidine/putrescine transport system permease protein
MSDASDTNGPVLAADGTPLKRSLARALRRQKMRALLLIAPLLLFILISFILPIADMLYRSVENKIVQETLPRSVVALADWDANSGELPSEAVYAAMAADLKEAALAKQHTKVAVRLNYEQPGIASAFKKAGRKAKKFDLDAGGPWKDELIKIHKRWGQPEIWRTIQTYSPPVTAGYFLNAVDMKVGPDGAELRPEKERIYNALLARTLWMSLLITASCIVLAYPVAWLLANLPSRTANLLMILVLLPFWTSLLVRTSAWKILLQQQGVINDILGWVGFVADDSRLQIINNQFGTVVAMTHILLPFMILPMYTVMQTIIPH